MIEYDRMNLITFKSTKQIFIYFVILVLIILVHHIKLCENENCWFSS